MSRPRMLVTKAELGDREDYGEVKRSVEPKQPPSKLAGEWGQEEWEEHSEVTAMFHCRLGVWSPEIPKWGLERELMSWTKSWALELCCH